MKSIPRLCIIFSLTMFAAARPAISDRAIRIPLERRSRNASDTISPRSVTGGQFSAADSAQRLVNSTHMKYAATFAAYERNTGSRHPLDTLSKSSSTSPSKSAGSGGEKLQNDQSLLWYGSIDIGTPFQRFEMDFDTGSADPWVPDKTCLFICQGHNTYRASQSSTSHGGLAPHVLQYGSGEAITFNVYTDVVTVAGITLSDQQFGGVDVLSSEFWNNWLPLSNQFPADGIFGLGFKEISSLHITPPVENLRKRSDLPRGFLSFQLSDDPGRSELIIGDANYDAFKIHTLECTPLKSEGYWQITMGGISRFGSQAFAATDVPAIVDTGTTLIVVPTNVANEYFSGVPEPADCSSGICAVPCNIIDSTRPTLMIEGTKFDVCPSTWNFGPVEGKPGYCYTGMGTSSMFGFVIIGDVFLRNVYSIFDFRELNVCFADLETPVC